MQIAIIKKSQLNNCWSALQYTGNCHQCDKIFSCKIKSPHHVNGLMAKEQFEIGKILKEQETRLSNLRANVQATLKSIKQQP